MANEPLSGEFEAPPPAGGFGVADHLRLRQPPDIVKRDPTPMRGASAHHYLFAGIGAAMAFLALAGFGYAWQKRKAIRSVEAIHTLGVIGKQVSEGYARHGALCPSAAPVPRDFDLVRGMRYQSATTDWTRDPGWLCLGFLIEEPQSYQYHYVETDELVTITAVGDLDGDDVRATYTLRGHVDAAGRRVVFDEPIRESNPGE